MALGDLFPDDLGSADHRSQLCSSPFARQVLHTAIRGDRQPLGGGVLQCAADTTGYHLGSLDLFGSEVDDTQHHRPGCVKQSPAPVRLSR